MAYNACFAARLVQKLERDDVDVTLVLLQIQQSCTIAEQTGVGGIRVNNSCLNVDVQSPYHHSIFFDRKEGSEYS